MFLHHQNSCSQCIYKIKNKIEQIEYSDSVYLGIIKQVRLIVLMLTDERNRLWRPVLALMGAGLSMTLSNPFDLIRIRMQTMTELVELGILKRSYEGVADCFRRVNNEEGVRAFWKGNGAKLIKFYSSQSLNFISKESIKTQLKSLDLNSIFLTNTLAGVLGSWISLGILYPIEHAQNKLSNSIGSNRKTIWSSIFSTFNKQGITGLYKGSSISLVGVAVFRGTYFGIYDTFKEGKRNLERWLLAYVSSLLAIVLTYPTDTIRRRLICTSYPTKYAGFLDCYSKIARNQGVFSLYRGGPIIFLQALSSASILFLYDKISKDVKGYCI